MKLACNCKEMLETEDPGCDLSPNRDITLLEISLLGFTLQYFKLNKTDEHFSHALLNTVLVYIKISGILRRRNLDNFNKTIKTSR